MQIEIIPEWQLAPADDAEIAALLVGCFPTDFGGRSYFHQRHHLRLITRDQGRIVGHMAITLRSVRLGDQRLEVAGLAEVATAPDHRGKGIAATLLQAAITAARARKAPYFLLLGNARLYAAAGFRKFDNPVTYLHIATNQSRKIRSEVALELMVLALTNAPWDGSAQLDLLGPLF